ncbi:hybrid signal transduction histidine kinase M [Tanacetum coccineum]
MTLMTLAPSPTDKWLTADSIVKSWIFLTLADTLQRRLIKLNPTTAKAAWEHVEKIFLNNKRTRTIALKGELRVIQMGDLSVNAYFSKTESIVTLLNDLGSPMSDDDVVSYAIHGLSDKFANVATIISHRVPFPDLDTMRSMVTTEDMRHNSKSQTFSANTTSSAPQVLIAETNASRGQDMRSSRDTARIHDPLSLKFVVILVEVFASGGIHSPYAFQKNMKITCEEVMKISNHFQESSQKLSSYMKNQEHYTDITSSKPIKPQSEWINLMHGEQSPKTLKFQQQKKQSKPCEAYKQSYILPICPICNEEIETEEHLFVKCEIAKKTWTEVLKWWNIFNVRLESINDIFSLKNRVNFSPSTTKIFDAVIHSTIWILWRFRNDTTFAVKRPSKDLILNDVKQFTRLVGYLIESRKPNVIGWSGFVILVTLSLSLVLNSLASC